MKNRFLIVAIVLVWFSVLAWFSFHHISGQRFERNASLLLMLALAGVAPLYPLYRLAKRWPSLLGGIVLTAVGCVIASVYIVAHYLLGLNSVWLERISDLNEGLLILTSTLLVWGACRNRW